MVEQKTCLHCKKVLPLEAFHSWSTRMGLKYGKWCQPCYESSGAGRKKTRSSDQSTRPPQ
jgi:hypothetical protein